MQKKTYYNANSAETNFMQLDKCMHFLTEQDWISEEESAVNINWLCYLCVVGFSFNLSRDSTNNG